MTKIELANNVYDKLGLTKEECANIVDKFLEIVKEALSKDEHVMISGFGRFSVKQKRARKGRNPQTGEMIELKARKVLLFNWSQALKDEINE